MTTKKRLAHPNSTSKQLDGVRTGTKGKTPKPKDDRPLALKATEVQMRELNASQRKMAAESGLLPHEFLLKVMRGEPIEQTFVKDKLDDSGRVVGEDVTQRLIYPTLDVRIDAAKHCAPYYAPRLATQLIAIKNGDQMSSIDIGTIMANLSMQQLEALEPLLADASKHMATVGAKRVGSFTDADVQDIQVEEDK